MKLDTEINNKIIINKLETFTVKLKMRFIDTL